MAIDIITINALILFLMMLLIPKTNRVPRLCAREILANVILDRIAAEVYKPGEWLPTERELAAEFHSDRATVRAALSLLADRRMVVRNPGYRTFVQTHNAGDLAIRYSFISEVAPQTLAILSPQTPSYTSSSAIQRGALQVLFNSEVPCHLAVLNTGGETYAETVRRERQALESLKNRGIRGAIVCHQGGNHTLPDIRRIQASHIPLVLVDQRDPLRECDFVGTDNVEAARKAVTYLLNLGHQRIMHLNMEDPSTTALDREKGYRDALAARGIQPGLDWIFRISNVDTLKSQVSAAAAHFLTRPEPPTSIFAMNDLLAHSLMSELQLLGCRIPEQISVIGFGHADHYSMMRSPLTTVHLPYEEMGAKAAELLLSRINAPNENPRTIFNILLEAQLVTRSSCLPCQENGRTL